GILPTEGENVGQILKNVLGRTFWPLGETAPDLPEDVCSLVDRMLVRDRASRVADLDAVREVFRRHMESSLPPVHTPWKPSESEAPSRFDPDAVTIAPGSRRESTIGGAATVADLVPAPAAPRRSRRAAAYYAVVATLVVSGGGAAYSHFAPSVGAN